MTRSPDGRVRGVLRAVDVGRAGIPCGMGIGIETECLASAGES